MIPDPFNCPVNILTAKSIVPQQIIGSTSVFTRFITSSFGVRFYCIEEQISTQQCEQRHMKTVNQLKNRIIKKQPTPDIQQHILVQ